ncbi:P4Hc [Seminavis robusta]|uniref:P4Hc n=1 Tax=Seminavis robusta TaxID=568900 RepID=A0A9N8DS62_9STRA|nr:P4Hc [Seminavis robusta]|eukprot:Sro313_g114960.1 P4Hc (384) ;mRNA; f:70278-71429
MTPTQMISCVLHGMLLLLPATSFSISQHRNRHPHTAFLFDSKNTKATSPSSLGVTATSIDDGTGTLVHDLQAELNGEDLGLCHGILHASGVRRLGDLKGLTDEDIRNMGADSFDRRNIQRVMKDLNGQFGTQSADGDIGTQEDPQAHPANKLLTTSVDGAFDNNNKILQRFEAVREQEFCIEPICLEHDVFKGRLFTVDQCEQINRMAEYHAYSKLGVIGGGWTNEMYTLTAQHIQCKEIIGMIPTTKNVFRQLFRELYELFPNRIRRGSIVFESDGEPHLVKYNGRVKGTAPHTDNSEFVYITVNVVLSAEDEYTGGGTYITELDQTIRLEQGEMLIHLGDLEHSGAEITSGVRRILIAFLACEWEDEALNEEKVEFSRENM